jgi:hypothetical protein
MEKLTWEDFLISGSVVLLEKCPESIKELIYSEHFADVIKVALFMSCTKVPLGKKESFLSTVPYVEYYIDPMYPLGFEAINKAVCHHSKKLGKEFPNPQSFCFAQLVETLKLMNP